VSDSPVVIITAASAGIGGGIARRLAHDGYRVSLLARSEGVHRVAKELGGTAVQGSVDRPPDLEHLVRHTMDAFGRVDALVNNTGHPAKGSPLELGDAEWQQGYELILASVIRLARLVTPIMRQRGGGSIVNMSSYAAVAPDPARPVSSVFRAALSTWTRVFAESAAPLGIRVNSILPGFIDTGHLDGSTVASLIPLKRQGTTAELAGVVAFLLSTDASYITGQNLVVDGGMVRRT
jgi:NAD(P)-dependent dehydrogenase (short-subunit alcohol dehydrogenase family)